VKPPRNPRAGTRPGGRAVARIRGIFAPRGALDQEEALVAPVDVPAYRREKASAIARVAGAEGHPLAADLRSLGLPVFDESAGNAELGGYTSHR